METTSAGIDNLGFENRDNNHQESGYNSTTFINETKHDQIVDNQNQTATTDKPDDIIPGALTFETGTEKFKGQSTTEVSPTLENQDGDGKKRSGADANNTTKSKSTDPVSKSVNATEFQEKKNKTKVQQVKTSERKTDEGLRPWIPFENAGTELPLTSRLNLPSGFYKTRWVIVRSFHHRVFEICNHSISLGECVFLPTFVVLFTLLEALAHEADNIAPASGRIASISILLTFVFSSKNSFLTFLIGMPYDRLLFMHKFMALISIILSLIHGINAPVEENEYATITGWVFMGIIIGMIVFGFYYLRRWFYEIFYKLHLLLAVGIIVLSILHNAETAAIGGLFWLLDYIIKLIVIGVNYRRIRTCGVKRYPAGVIQIRFKKEKFLYRSGQHVTICIPKVSYFEWHSFSISSAPHEEYVTIHIRVLGDWTKRLHKLACETNEKDWTVFINGPFGVQDIHQDHEYRLFLMISGGIGVTPLQSIANELLHQSSRGRKIYKIMFVWSVRNTSLLTSVRNDIDEELAYDEDIPHDLPVSFQPDLMPHGERRPVSLDNYYHLTQIQNDEQLEAVKAKLAPSIQNDVCFGRPHLSVYFEKMFETAKRLGESRVAVLCCGPLQMMDETDLHANSFSRDGIEFECHFEVFEY